MTLPASDTEIVLLHNPRCSKSRATLALLEERGVDFTVRRYLEQPLSRDELGDLALRLGLPVAEWLRQGETAFADAALDTDAGHAALLEAMARYPILIERPILIRGKRARVGRPPEAVLDLLD